MANNTNLSSRLTISYALHPGTVWYWSLRVVIAVVAVLGNGIVVWLIVSRRKLWTRPNCFVLSLSLADLGTGVVNTPLEFSCTVLGSHCDMWLVQTIKDIFLVSSVFNLCATTIDRYVAVVHSLRYTILINHNICILIIASAWGLGLILPFLFFAIIRFGELKTYRFISIFRLLLSNVLPMIGLVLAYIRMLSILRRHRRKVEQQRQQVDFNHSRSLARVNKKAASSVRAENTSAVHFIGSMVTFFVFCYSLTFYRVLSSYILLAKVPAIIVPLSRILYYLNSALNFLVYALFKKDIKTEARSLFIGYCRSLSATDH